MNKNILIGCILLFFGFVAMEAYPKSLLCAFIWVASIFLATAGLIELHKEIKRIQRITRKPTDKII
jgi:hypothetical protein